MALSNRLGPCGRDSTMYVPDSWLYEKGPGYLVPDFRAVCSTFSHSATLSFHT
jgi:hypothetical protein